MNVTEASKVFDIAWGIVKKNKKNNQPSKFKLVDGPSWKW